MKPLKAALLFMMLLFVAATGCDDGDPKYGTIDDLSPYVQQYLSMHNASFSSYSAESNDMMNRSFQALMQNLNAHGRLKGDTIKNDTTLFPDPWEWHSCAVVTTIQNANGSTTEIRDYGDGCQEGYPGYYYWIHGKITTTRKQAFEEIGSLTRYNYEYENDHENYGGRYVLYNGDSSEWTIDGHGISTGSAEYNSVTGVFTGEFSHDGESVYESGGIERTHKTKGHTVYTEEGWITDLSEFEYRYGDYFYSTQVTVPLVFKHSCNRRGSDFAIDNYVWVYVSGKETVQYNQDGVAGNFTIDYGDGGCDNIIYITENGMRVKVDLSGWRWFCGITTTDVGG